MTIKNSLIKSIKSNSLRREVTFILNDANDAKKIKREICNHFDKINLNLNNRLDVIAKLTDLIPAKLSIGFTSPNWPIYNNNICETISILYNPENLRVLINFEDFNSKDLNTYLETKKEISHLVEVSFIEHSENDLNSYESPSSTIYVSTPLKVIKVIEDIMLDISMYYTVFSEQIINDIEFRNRFSYDKVNHIERTNLKSNDWDIKKNKGYVALAGYFWDGTQFDYLNYVQLWKRIGDDLGIKVKNTNFLNVTKQLKLHKDYGELPLKSVEKTFNQLEKGEYILARLTKIPKRHKAQATLLSIFGGSKIKRGKWKFFTKENANIFDKFTNNVSLFKILKG